MRKPNKYIVLLVLVFTAYGLFEYYRPRPINWNSTYRNNDRIPFGAQALYELLPDLFPTNSVKMVRLPIYNFLGETKLPARSNYVFVAHDFNADRNDLKRLLTYVRQGNSVFISAYDLSDSLGIMLGFRATEKDPIKADSTLRQNFVNPQLHAVKGYNFPRDDGRNFLQIKNGKNITVLGRNARNEPVFIRIKYGEGQVFVQNLPLAFTNYYVLDPKTSDYAFNVLSYLPAVPTYWDEYQKQGRFDEDQQSILRYIRSQPALTWAYYLLIFGVIFYAIFAGKRTQRIIPVVEPPHNTSLDFVKTVGRLYFHQGDHDNLARKRIQYFLADLREQYGLNTSMLDKEFIETLARKSGAPLDETADLVRMLRDAQRSISLSEFDLIRLNRAMEQFNHQL